MVDKNHNYGYNVVAIITTKEKKQMKKTPERREAIIKAIMEGKVEKEVLLTEIRIALEDYFMGKFEEAENKIILKLFNGQKFEIVLNEV